MTGATGIGAAPAVGAIAPAFDLPALGGGRVRLEDQRSRAGLVSFLRHAG